MSNVKLPGLSGLRVAVTAGAGESASASHGG